MFDSKKNIIMMKIVEDTVGSREKYINFTKENKLTKESKDILLQASVTIRKKNIDMIIVEGAYKILIAISGEEEYSATTQHTDDYNKKKSSFIGEPIIDSSEKSSKITMDESAKIIEKTKQTKIFNFKYVQVAILIGILFLVFKNFSINKANKNSEVRKDLEAHAEKLNISCDDDVVEKLVNRLALNEMGTRVNRLIYNTNLGVMRFAIEDADYALMNVKNVMLTSIYTTRRDNGVGRVECTGTVNATSGKHFIPANVEYSAQLNDYGTNVQVQLISLQFTKRWITQ